MKMKLQSIGVAVVALATSAPAFAAFVVNTGTPLGAGNTPSTGFTLSPTQSLAAKFTLSNNTVVTRIEGYIAGNGGNGKITLFGDGTVPETANFINSFDFSLASTLTPGLQTGAWQGVSGFSVNLAAGSYWVTFESDGENGMMGGTPSPLSDYAYKEPSISSNWVPDPFAPNFGVRVGDDRRGGPGPGAVPEPATWAMMLIGFGAIGGAMRSRRRVSVSYG